MPNRPPERRRFRIPGPFGGFAGLWAQAWSRALDYLSSAFPTTGGFLVGTGSQDNEDAGWRVVSANGSATGNGDLWQYLEPWEASGGSTSGLSYLMGWGTEGGGTYWYTWSQAWGVRHGDGLLLAGRDAGIEWNDSSDGASATTQNARLAHRSSATTGGTEEFLWRLDGVTMGFNATGMVVDGSNSSDDPFANVTPSSALHVRDNGTGNFAVKVHAVDYGIHVTEPGTGAGELMRLEWGGDATVDSDQYWLACYDSTTLVGGLAGDGSAAGLLWTSVGDFTVDVAADIKLDTGTSSFVRLLSTGTEWARFEPAYNGLGLGGATHSYVWLDGLSSTNNSIALGAYRDGTPWKASATDAFLIQRNSGVLTMWFDNGLTAGTSAPSWNKFWEFDTSTEVLTVTATTNQGGIWCKSTAGGSAERTFTAQLGSATPGTDDYYLACRDSGGGLDGYFRANGSGGIDTVHSSDMRGKRSIADAAAVKGQGLAKVRRIRNRQWQHIDNPAPDAPLGLGWVAQELLEVFPEAVHVPGPDNPDQGLGVIPSNLIPLLVEATQELDRDTAALGQRVAQLEAQVEAQAARLAQVEAQVAALVSGGRP